MSSFDATALLDEAAAFEEAFQTRDSLIPTYEPNLTEQPSDRFRLFEYDRYDWTQFDPETYGYNILRSKKGYFAPVSLEQYEDVAEYNWWANVQLDRTSGKEVKIYLLRYPSKTESSYGAPKYIYLHRHLTKTIFSGSKVLVDHRNADSLDHRDYNLRVTNQRGNNNNSVTGRRRTLKDNTSLPRGVEPVMRLGADGTPQEKYFGRIIVRGKNVRSKKPFTTPEAAHRWYMDIHAKLHPEACSVNSATAPPPPLVFPPLVKSLSGDVPF